MPPNISTRLLEYIAEAWDSSVRCGQSESWIRPVPVPHTVPSPAGNYKALFYWDLPFTNLGLLRSGRMDLALSNCEALAWLVDQDGYIPNSTYIGDNLRSQPPMFAAAVRDVYERTGDKPWLEKMMPRLEKEHAWWMAERSWPDGLNHNSHGYDSAYCLRFYKDAVVPRFHSPEDIPEAVKMEVAGQLIAEAETGMDFTPIYDHRCGHFAPLQLNLILWAVERDLAHFCRELGRPDASAWLERADKRAALIRKSLWSQKRGLFLSYDVIYRQPARIAALDTFYALYFGFATQEEAGAIRSSLALFEREQGVAATEDYEGAGSLQWAYPIAWPPLTWICAAGLARYGFRADAIRIADKYCSTMESQFSACGHLYEKYDSRTGEPDKSEYAADNMLGWTAGVYIALNLLRSEHE